MVKAMSGGFDSILQIMDEKVDDLQEVSRSLSSYFSNQRYQDQADRVLRKYHDKREQLMNSELSDTVKAHRIQDIEIRVDLLIKSYQVKKNKLNDIDNLKDQSNNDFGITIKSLFLWNYFLELYTACINAIKYDNIALFDFCYEKYESVYNKMASISEELKKNELEKIKLVLDCAQLLLGSDRKGLLSEGQEEKIKVIQSRYESVLEKTEHSELLNTKFDGSILKNIIDESDQSKFKLTILRKLDQCVTQIHGHNTYFSINDDLISEWVNDKSISENFDKIIQNMAQ